MDVEHGKRVCQKLLEVKENGHWSFPALASGTGANHYKIRRLLQDHPKTQEDWDLLRIIAKKMHVPEDELLPESQRALPVHDYAKGLGEVTTAYHTGSVEDRAGLVWLAQYIMHHAVLRNPIEKPSDLKIIPYEDRPILENTRSDFPWYTIRRVKSRRKAKVSIPHWLGLAAGEGMELELSDEVTEIVELEGMANLHSATIRGDSMLHTVKDGDIVVLRCLREEGIELPPVRDIPRNERTPLSVVRSLVRPHAIAMVSINDEPPTLKRVKYTEKGSENDWGLTIAADNPHVDGFPRHIGSADKVLFYALMIGFGKYEQD
jgi:transcriptional regulator with XRE-family HTH domain